MSHQTPPTTSSPTFCFFNASSYLVQYLSFLFFSSLFPCSLPVWVFHSVCFSFLPDCFSVKVTFFLLLRLRLVSHHWPLHPLPFFGTLYYPLNYDFISMSLLSLPLIISVFIFTFSFYQSKWTHYYLLTYHFYEGHLPSLYLVPGKNETKYLYLYYI